MKYKAFLSYSHADRAWVHWLHERLERYRVPRKLRRGASAAARIGPVFKDREELSATHSLSETIEQALDDSEFLVVVASSQAAGSRWVNEEIRHFLERHEPSRLILVIPPGETAPALPEFDELTRRGLEPVAADARREADGPVRAVRKVIARLIGVGFDELQQRDRRRQRQRYAAVAAALLVIAGTVSLLSLESRRATQEARAQRAQAAQLAEFLVDDLATRLDRYEDVGTLDAGLARALEFFERMDPSDMDKATLEDYRAALTGVGSVRIRQGKPAEALETFFRAETVSLEIARREEDNAERWHEQAASTYYIGEAYWELQDVANAAVYIEKSMEYADRALQLAPSHYPYQLEVVFSLNNLGAVHARLKNWQTAEGFSKRAVELVETLLDNHELTTEQRLELLNQEAEAASWLVEISHTLGRFDEAFGWHERERALRNTLYDETGIPQQRARLVDSLSWHSKSLAAVGRLKDEARALEEAIELADTLSRDDPENVFWRLRLNAARALLAMNLLFRGQPAEAWSVLEAAEAGLGQIIEEQGTPLATFHLAYALSARAYGQMDRDPEGARRTVNEGLALLAEPMAADNVHPIALGHYTRLVVLDSALGRLSGERPNLEAIDRALDEIPIREDLANASIFDVAARALLAAAAGEHTEAAGLVGFLEDVGYRSAFYTRMLELLRDERAAAN